MTTRLQDLQAQAAAHAKTAREIAEGVQARDDQAWTEDERSRFNAAMKAGNDLLPQIKAAKDDADLLAQASKFADTLGLPAEVLDDVAAQMRNPDPKTVAKTLGETFVESKDYLNKIANKYGDGRPIPQNQHVDIEPVSFTSLLRADRPGNLLTGGSKTSGGAFVVTERTNILEMLGRRPLALRDVISVRRTGSDTVEFVRQTAHSNAAAPVAEATSSAGPAAPAGTAGGALVNDANGGYKPEGSWAFEVVSASVKTIAEWVSVTKRALADVAQLEGVINDELTADLAEKEEDQIVNGDGTGQNLPGVLNTSGIQTLGATTTNDATRFASVRTALTKLRTIGRVAPNAILANPAQTEWIDTAKDSQNRFYGNGPFGLAPRTLWGIPVVESEAIPAGTLVPGDWSKAVLWDREQAAISATDSHADFFIRNLVAVLGEERVAFGVTRPKAFITVTGF